MIRTLQISAAQLFGLASALASAHRIGLTQALLTGPASAHTLAQTLGLAERPVRLVLELMVSFDLAERHGVAYTAAPVLRTLQNSVPGGLRHEAELWAHLPQWLTDDQPLTEIDSGPRGREAEYAGVVAGLGDMFGPAARALARRLRRIGRRVLDVGCGSGVWGLALAEHDPTVHVTGLDFPSVLEVFAERARSLRLDERVAMIPGDAHQIVVATEQYDTVLFANVLHLEPAERARALLHRWMQAVIPGGFLVVIDALVGGTPEAERARALYTVHLAMRSREGSVHAPDSIVQWLKEAGLEQLETIELGDSAGLAALGAIVGRRPT